MAISPTPEGIKAIETSSANLKTGCKGIMDSVRHVESEATSHNKIIKFDELAAILESIRLLIGDATGPAEKLAEALDFTAEAYAELVEMPDFSGITGNK